MKILYHWLKEFVDVAAPPAELRARLSMCGIAVESIEDSVAGPVLDLDLTTNRPDCLSHFGVAREVAALYRLPLKSRFPQLEDSSTKAADVTRVEIECLELCGRYTARVIRGVKVAESPAWLKQRLEALGQAPINNVVDATNYVMFELGHPLHAFDLDTLAEGRIVVRRARQGEKMRTLDGMERSLMPEMCMIADAKSPVAVGGVMGGAATEISTRSTNVLLESAWFEPITLRRTAKALGMRTEASVRFERGMDIEMAELASRHCALLIQELAGGEVLGGVVDAYPQKWAEQTIELSRRELLRVMGADVPDRDVEEILSALGFAPERMDSTRGASGHLMAAWRCRRPPWRLDVAREIDLVEEVARHYGFEKFPARPHASKQAAARLPYADAEDRVRERLLALGYSEIVTIPFVDEEHDALFRGDDIVPARLGNPLSEDAATLRSTGLVNMLRAIEWNLNRGQRNLRFFEIGRKYELRDGRPVETPVLTLGASGKAREKGIHEEAREFRFAELKGDLDSLGELAGGFDWKAGAPAWLHPARSACIVLSAAAHHAAPDGCGVAGQLSRRIAEQFKLRQDVYVAELLLAPLLAAHQSARASRRYQPIPRFPAVERDFSLILADEITFAQVAEAIRSLGIAELARIEAGDFFRGGQIPAGKHSLLVRVLFQSHEATLTEAQLNDFTARIVKALEGKLGAALRTV
jgi:phenylalanyl-tRNA synthetase beta chain